MLSYNSSKIRMYISPKAYWFFQVGVPSDRQQYIHRLGRTGRKGKEGQGILLLAPWEKYFLNSVNDLSIAETVAPLANPSIQAEVGSI